MFRSAFASMPSSPQRATFRIRRLLCFILPFLHKFNKNDNSLQEEYPFIRWAGRVGRQRPPHLCSPIEGADEKACRVAWRHWRDMRCHVPNSRAPTARTPSIQQPLFSLSGAARVGRNHPLCGNPAATPCPRHFQQPSTSRRWRFQRDRDYRNFQW